jgi:two-component system phosphate regulon sensor histidine kinase PhoR
MTILVVEDDAVQRRLLRFFLEQQGYQVISASNVSEALTCIQPGLPDALLLDAMLPDGSGLDVCRQIRQLPEGQTLPVLLLTAYDIEPVVVEAFEAGATDFIPKPVNLKLLERRLHHLLRAARHEAVLREREQQYRTLVNTLPDVVIRGRRDGTVTYFKPSETCPAEMFNLEITPDTRLAAVLPAEGITRIEHALNRLTAETQLTVEYRAQCHSVWREFEARLIADGPNTFVAIIRDVTDHKTTERLREDFTAMVAHDIRSPLTAMQMALELLEAQDACANQNLQEIVSVARQGLNKVLQLAGDLLELFRANQTGMTLLKGVVFPAVLLKRCVGEISLQAQGKNLDLTLEAPEDLPPFVGDGPKLERVVSNLLSNALKFTPEGGRITVSGATDGEWMVISVADTGPGIAPELQATMFEPYRQGGKHRSLGVGLGLAIVKRIVTAHRGRISVESTEGQGTTFTVRLPLHLNQTVN